ncbi:MAG: hypothetical protein ABUL44_02990, partial [Flavobacterium sp.]
MAAFKLKNIPNIVIIAAVVILILLLHIIYPHINQQNNLPNFLAFFILISFILWTQELQKSKIKTKIIATQKQELLIKNEELENQKNIVEVKNREILDSIEYALKIQTAILPTQKIVKQYLESSFILYKPKDIVAGDFYWMETINDIVLFAACDCTGHGVPGAMVSVVCHNALNRAV